MNKGYKSTGVKEECSSLSRKLEKALKKNRRAKERRKNKNFCKDY